MRYRQFIYFFRDLAEYQRAISFFEETKTQEEKDEFLKMFNEGLNQYSKKIIWEL